MAPKSSTPCNVHSKIILSKSKITIQVARDTGCYYYSMCLYLINACISARMLHGQERWQYFVKFFASSSPGSGLINYLLSKCTTEWMKSKFQSTKVFWMTPRGLDFVVRKYFSQEIKMQPNVSELKEITRAGSAVECWSTRGEPENSAYSSQQVYLPV